MEELNPDLVLILAPYGRDAELLTQVLRRAGVRAQVCAGFPALLEQFRHGAAVAVIADEALSRENITALSAALSQQPSWSDFPVLLLTGSGEITEASRMRVKLLEPLGNLTFIERPLRTATFVSAVQTALRARRRQYQILEQLEKQRALITAARENEEKLTFALEAAQLGSWELHLPSKQLNASSQLKRNFGIHPEEPFSWDTWRRLVHPDDLPRVQQALEFATSTRTAFQEEFRIIRADGSTAWIFSAGRPVADGAGGSRIVGVGLDITERRKGEEAVRKSESQLRALADSMPQLAWMAKPDGYIIWYNRRWYEYTGKTLPEMEGWGWQCVHDPQILPEVRARWNDAVDRRAVFEMEFPLRNAAGEFRWFLTQARPVYNSDGEVVRWFGTNTDIDDKRKAEKALRESEKLARSVIENSPDCVEVLDNRGITLLVNAACCRLLRVPTASDASGADWVATWPPAWQVLAREALQNAVAGREANFEAAARGQGREGMRCEVIVTPIVDSEGAVNRVLCVSRDITARLRAEEELRESAKLESLGVMAGGIAHDFNNLLTGILGNASMLAERAVGSERSLADDIVLAAERASDLTRQMLAYSGRGRFENRNIDLSKLVKEMFRLVRPVIDPNVEVDVEACRTPCVLQGDPGQIQQIIMNLLINAGEAMDGRPGIVTVSTGHADVQQETPFTDIGQKQVAPGEYVYLEVSDNGKGMDEATRARIFDPFFTTKFTGRGLGLAAVSGIVRGHHGALRVTSEPGKGSTFRVMFPSVRTSAPKAGEKQSPLLKAQGGLVLFVDDETIIQRTAEAALIKHGYSVQLASNGKQAVEIFRTNQRRIDAVVLDSTMPVMDGEEALKLIRQIDQEVPVIISSGYSESEVERRFHSHQVHSFLHKPYTASMLLLKIQELLGTPV